MNRELPAGSTLSHYRIVSKLGAGGMGEVYLAQDTQLDRKVALKILPAELASNRDRMERFVREAKSAAALNHPNIATIHEIGKSDEVNFIAMEFIDGATLREKLYRERTELRKLLRYLQHVAEGLAKAHAAGIVHRDLKPDNIMVTHDGHAKILDFGLAKLLETKPESAVEVGEAETAMMPVQHSTPGVVMGTVGYMSPEQAQAKPVDLRSDIFSFGCILYEAVTGRKPFAGDSVVDTLHKIIHDPAAAITDFNPSAPTELQRVIRKCLAKEPEKRYQTIRDTANDLEELLEEMKGVSDLERSVAPSTNTTTSGALGGTAEDVRAQSTASGSQQPSSAEYVITGIKLHKLATAIVGLVLLGVISSIGYFAFVSKDGSTTQISSIAVMPFENRSGNADSEYLSDGLTESLIYRLSQLPNLKVSPANSVFRYKGKDADVKTIASELRVNAVMVGRMSQRGDDLSISVELIDAANNKLLWGEQYDRKSSDLLVTQREIAAAIVQKLQLKFSGSEGKGLTKTYTDNNEAYQLYLKGRFYWNKRNAESLRKAIEQFQAAADKDPNYALAYVGLADCYVLLPFYGRNTSQDVLPKAKAYAQRALEIDPSLGEAHASLAYTNYMLWNWAEAEAGFKRAIELSPNHSTGHKWYANYLEDSGRPDESLKEFRKAQELDPLSLIINENLADRYLQIGDLDLAYTQGMKVIDIDPNYAGVHRTLSLIYLKRGQHKEALTAAQKAVELSERSGIYLSTLGFVYAQTGNSKEALTLVKELEEKFSRQEADGHHIAAIFAGLGDKDTAFEWLEKDFRKRVSTLVAWMNFTTFDSLRGDPRMADLRRRMGLPQ